jgi:hypothetical protein
MAMNEHNSDILDIAHIAFLDMIKVFIDQLGANYAGGILVRSALHLAQQMPEVHYASWEEFNEAIQSASNPITRVEGKAEHFGRGLFGLPHCPFAASVKDYKTIYGELPKTYADVTSSFNRPNNQVAQQYHVGSGAGVSPFCSIHQPLRSAIGSRITIENRSVAIFQLGCKAANGHKGLAEELIVQAGFTKKEVETVLDDHMCCYAVTLVG